MIEVENLSKSYGGKLAVDNISFTANDGEILGFLGPNGAGKTTTMNIITGYLSATAGTARINGADILENPIEAKLSLGYLPEQPPLYLDMTVREYLNFVYGLKRCKLPKKSHLGEIAELTGITDVERRVIRNLSKGYKQRVGLAQALVGNPSALILDEPTVGLDPKQIIGIRELIKRLGEHHTVILSSHILSEIQTVCDRVVVIDHGKLIANDTADNLSRNLSADNKLLVQIEGASKEVMELLRKIPDMESVRLIRAVDKTVSEYELNPKNGKDIRREVFKRMAARSFPILMMRSSELSLEEIFLKLTEKEEKNA